MIQKRALGPSFSTGERCRISSNFLPNKMHQVAKYSTKAFCGSYSKDGRFFLTASQGKSFFFYIQKLLFIMALIFLCDLSNILADKFLRLYRTHDGDFVQFKTIPARDVGWSILDTAFSPDGNYIVYSSWSECCKYIVESNMN